MTDPSNIGLATAFLAGVVSFLSPCVLLLVPACVPCVAAQSVHRRHLSFAA